MATKLQELKWKIYKQKSNQLLLWGLDHGYVTIYNDELIEKLRTIYYGGIPASILLLSKGMSDGRCYDRALLMSRAFLDEKKDVKLIYAFIDNLRLNPEYIDNDNPFYAEHCVVEITDKNDQCYIIDTSDGLIYDKKLYWIIEHPKIKKIDNKESIINLVEADECYCPENIERDKYIAPVILSMIENTYGKPNEFYSQLGIELLQREIEHFKKVIDYDSVCQEIDEDMRRLGFKR